MSQITNIICDICQSIVHGQEMEDYYICDTCQRTECDNCTQPGTWLIWESEFYGIMCYCHNRPHDLILYFDKMNNRIPKSEYKV